MPPRTSSTAPSQDYDQAIKLNSGYAVAFYNRGNAKYDKGDYARAIADYDSAIKLNPADAARLQQPRQRLCQQARIRPRHRRLLTQAIKLNPGYAQAYNDRGVAYAAKGDIDRALADFEQAVKFDRQQQPGLFTIAASPIATSTTSTARSRISTRRSSSMPNYAAAYLQSRQRAYAFKRDYDRAIADYRPGDQTQAGLCARLCTTAP